MPEKRVTNAAEVGAWIFQRTQIDGHICDGVKSMIDGENINISYRDRETGETIDVIYD